MRDTIEKYFIDNSDTFVKRYKRACGEANAEDIVQTAFEWALKYADSYDSSKTIEGWFSGILRNSFRKFKREEFPASRPVEEWDLGLEDDAFKTCMLDKVGQVMEAKRVDHKNVLFLYFFKDYTVRDIARVTDFNNQNISRIVLRFKQELKDKYGEAMHS